MRRFILTVLPLVLLLAIPSPAAAAPGSAIDGLRVRPHALNFGRLAMGACDTDTLVGCKLKTITVTNTSSAPITIHGIGFRSTIPNQMAFGADTTTCITTLAPGASCQISFTVAPWVTGKISGRVEIAGVDQFDVLAVIPVRAIGYVPS